MKRLAAVVVILLSLVCVPPAGAQQVRGFAGAGMVSDLNEQRFPAVSGGVLVDLPSSWFTAGAQGEMFISWPYVAGRGALFGQVNVVRRGTIRPFFLAGYGFGEDAGPLIGGGVEFRLPDRRVGLRVSVEDYLARVEGFDCATLGYEQSYCDATAHGGRPYTGHRVAVRVGLLF